jgi:hypothetical protein
LQRIKRCAPSSSPLAQRMHFISSSFIPRLKRFHRSARELCASLQVNTRSLLTVGILQMRSQVWSPLPPSDEGIDTDDCPPHWPSWTSKSRCNL